MNQLGTGDYLVESTLNAAEFIVDGKRMLAEKGISRIGVSRDLDALGNVCRSLRTKLSEHFDPSYMGPLSHRVLWFAFFDESGKVAGINAARRDDTGDMPLDEYIRQDLHRLNGGKFESVAPGLENFKGNTAYFGQGYLVPRFRSDQIGATMFRVSQAYLMLEWRPNVIWGLMNKEVALKGFFARHAFFQGIPHVAEDWWEELPKEYQPYYLITWSTADQLAYMCKAGHKAFVAGLGKQQKSDVVHLKSLAG